MRIACDPRGVGPRTSDQGALEEIRSGRVDDLRLVLVVENDRGHVPAPLDDVEVRVQPSGDDGCGSPRVRRRREGAVDELVVRLVHVDEVYET